MYNVLLVSQFSISPNSESPKSPTDCNWQRVLDPEESKSIASQNSEKKHSLLHSASVRSRTGRPVSPILAKSIPPHDCDASPGQGKVQFCT